MARSGYLKSLLIGGACALAMAGAAAAQTRDFNVPGGDLKAALDAYARQSGTQLIYRLDDVRGARSHGARGALSPDQALAEILADTPFTVQRDASGATAVVRSGSDPKSEGARSEPDRPTAVEEVVVTAKTGTQAVRKISGSVSALTGAQLESMGAQSFADYLTRTPGVVFNAGVPGLSTVAIRGVSTITSVSNNQGTTGYFINDVPLTDPFNSAGIPDIDAFDVDNVTVLRGPQGTLFGATSLGGAINYQAARPNLSDYQVHVQGTVENTRDGSAGGAAKVMVNVPVVQDKLAVRGVYVHRSDGGYIDNLGTGRVDANRTTVDGGRLEVTWTPTSSTSVNYMFLDQSEDTADVGDEEPLLAGPLSKTTLIPEFADFRTQIHNLRVDQDLGFATLTATATYHKKTSLSVSDVSGSFGPYLPGVTPIPSRLRADSDGTSFEVRLASHAGGRFDYLIGAYHDQTNEQIHQTFSGSNAEAVIEAVYGPIFGAGIGAAGAPGGVFFYGDVPFKGQETAAFGEATYHLTDALKVTVGGRLFDTRSRNTTTTGGFFNFLSSGELQSQLEGRQHQTGFAPKASITWTPSEDFLAYGLVAKGFRFGGPNINQSSPGFPIPPAFNSDSLVNYEAGVRTNWWDRRLQLDATAFYVDWSDIQLMLFTPLGLTYMANAGKATNYGFEGTATWRIAPELTLQSNVTYLNATLADDFDPGAGEPIIPSGSVLPGASKWLVANTLSYRFANVPATPLLALSHRYISRAPGDFSGGVPQGGYNLFDARATFHFDRVDLSAFADNIGNSHGVTSGTLINGPLEQFIVRPFTVGLTFDFKM